jgi:hypothetical protein
LRLAMTMTACARPNYLRETLESLAANKHLDKFTLHFGVEPVNPEVLNVCQSVTFMDTHVHLNAARLGVRENPYQLLKRTFGMGYDGVLYLEDDVALSSDAVELVLDFVQNADVERHRSLCLYNTDSRADADPAVIETGHSAAKFSPWVFFTTAAHWANFFEPTWHTSPKGWDWSITESGADNTIALPAISRSRHIGRFGGTHYVAEMYDHLFVNNPFWHGAAPAEYRISAV